MFYIPKSKKKDVPLIDSIKGILNVILDYALCFYILLMLVVFPFYNEEGYAHIGTDKAMFFRKVSMTAGKNLFPFLLVYLVVSLVIWYRDREKDFSWKKTIRQNVSATDCFAVFYCVALVISYLTSDYRENALWGAKGWFMGLIPQLIFVAIYLCLSRLWTPRKWLLMLALPASAAVFVLGCLNRFGIYPIEMAYTNAAYISTIGNLNWYCGYAVAVSFLGIILLWHNAEKNIVWKVLLTLYTVLGFINLAVQGSASGVFALGVFFVILFCCSVKSSEEMVMFWQQMVLFWGGCFLVYIIRLFEGEGFAMTLVDPMIEKLTFGRGSIIMTFVSLLCLLVFWKLKKENRYPEKLFGIMGKAVAYGGLGIVLLLVILITANTLHPGCLGKLSEYGIFTFNAEWGSSRGATWGAGWRCFAEQDILHKLTGVGPDCMPEYIYNAENQDFLVAVREQFGGTRLTNAHNEWLTILVNVGILGLIGYGGMIVCGIRDLLKRGMNNPVVCACGFCLLVYTLNNIFSFQQSMSTATVFVIFGAGEAFLRKEGNKSL